MAGTLLQRGRRSRAPKAVAILANYNVYDVQAASRTLREDTWSLPRGDLAPGDMLVFWRTLGPDNKRGIVALGQVTAPPEVQNVTPAGRLFWQTEVPDVAHRRVAFEYLKAPGLPLWLDEDPSGILVTLSVSRAQGNKLYKVTTDQWRQILELSQGSPPEPAAPAPVPRPETAPKKKHIRRPLEEVVNQVEDHLRRFGTITEAEVTRLAGNPRSYRKVRRAFDAGNFPLIIETTGQGKIWRMGVNR